MTKVVTVVTTKKAAVESEKKKGELMENDQDAMEVMAVPYSRGVSPSVKRAGE